MTDILVTIGKVIGGLGLFLIGMHMMTEGMKLSAGSALQRILGQWTSSSLRGLLSGFIVTAMVQSSSAVTVATIGFVNAGLLTLGQSIVVIYGANVGTTITGWLVALTGLDVDLKAFALPLIGIGAALRLIGGSRRSAAIGEALAGFGVFFLGVDILGSTFKGLGAQLDFSAWEGFGPLSLVAFVLLGFVMTLLTQSSSAAMAITLTATAGGIIAIEPAAAVVIGANLGTTSTAVFASIGATPNAKRVAAGHVAFNLLTGFVALLILPLFLWAVRQVGHTLGMEDAPAATLALFHTGFNLLGVLLMWPLTTHLVRRLQGRFRSREEDLGQPRHLDRTVLPTPALALNALELELERIGDMARSHAQAALSAETGSDSAWRAERNAAQSLSEAVGDFINHMQQSTLPREIATQLPEVLRVAQYYLEIIELADEVRATHNEAKAARVRAPVDEYTGFLGHAADLLTHFSPKQEGFTLDDIDRGVDEVKESYESLKRLLLEAGAAHAFPVRGMTLLLEQITRVRRIVEQAGKAARYQQAMKGIADNENRSPAPAETTSPGAD